MKKLQWGAAALLLAALAISGCASPAAGSGAAALKTIRVEGSALEIAIVDGVTEYDVYAPGYLDRVALSAEAVDPAAVVDFGGTDSRALAMGPDGAKVKVTVTSPDRRSTACYTLNIVPCLAKARLTTMDSVNGSVLEGAAVTYSAYRYGTLLGQVRSSENPLEVYLPAGIPFTVVASVRDRASSSYENVVAKPEGNDYFFYCQKLGMSTFKAVAPTIRSVQKTLAADPSAALESEWTDVEGSVLDLSAVTAIRVKLDSYSVVEPTSWSGQGVQIDFDNVPGTFNGMDAYSTENPYDARRAMFRTSALFAVGGMRLLPGPHSLVVVAYDRGNNRVERRIPVEVASALPEGADLSGCKFASVLADMRTYGVSREYFSAKGSSTLALQPLPSGGTSYRIALSFKLLDAANANQPILGFDVKRSLDGGTTWVAAGGVAYGANSAGAAGTHSFFDVSPSLVTGAAYSYKIEAYTDATHRLESAPVSGILIPAFTASLVSPAHGAKDVEHDDAAGLGPDYSFRISDPSLWNPAVADYFYFAPIVREKTGTILFYGEFRYRLSTNAVHFKYGGSWYDLVSNAGGVLPDYVGYEDGLVTLKAPLFALGFTNWYSGAAPAFRSGVTYEWDVFGGYTPGAGNLASPSAMVSSYFAKTVAGSLCRSYADVYQNGQQTLNGWFEFTAK